MAAGGEDQVRRCPSTHPEGPLRSAATSDDGHCAAQTNWAAGSIVQDVQRRKIYALSSCNGDSSSCVGRSSVLQISMDSGVPPHMLACQPR